MCNTPVEVQFTSAGCLNYPCRTPPASALVVAIENYDRHPKLEKGAAAASALAHALAEGGIANACPNCLTGGKSQELAGQILSWMRDADHDDRLLLYWSGHGMREADGFYLITQDSPANDFNQTNAVEPRSLAKGAANSKARKLLIILDACFSGEALGDLVATISHVLSGQAPVAGSRRGIAVLASAHALQKAQEGIVVSGLLKELLTDSQTVRRWSDEEYLRTQIRIRLKRRQTIRSADIGDAAIEADRCDHIPL